MKKKVLTFVGILILVSVIGMTTVFATSYTSSYTFSNNLTGSTRSYQGGTNMGINCYNTECNVDPYYELVNTPVTFNVTLYKGSTSQGTVYGFPMSTSTTYNYKWYGAGPGSNTLSYHYNFAAVNTREYNPSTGVYDYASIHGHCQLYSE